MIKKYKTLKIIWLSIFWFIVLFVWFFSAIWGTDEALKMISYKDRLSEQGIESNYLNSISDVIVDSANNEYIDVINKYKWDVAINPQNTFFTQTDYKGESISLNNTLPNNTISFVHNNGDRLDSSESVSIGTDYYALSELAPKNPTSILPIHKPCDRVINWSGALTYVNCETFITTDNQPLFVSFFENGNEYQWGWFTIVEVRKKSDESLEKRFFIGWSKKWDLSMNYVVHKSYTYWILQSQDRSNLYIPNKSWNINLDWVTTTTYDTLTQWEYSIYFQNINKYGLKSDKILAGYLAITPPVWALADFDFINITDTNKLITTTISWSLVSVNFKNDAHIRINNPWSYDYDILSIVGWVNKVADWFTVDELREGDNIFNIQIKDQAGNILDNKPLIVTVDTIAPSIQLLTLDTSFLNQDTTDEAIAMINYLWSYHVNDNLDFSWISWWNKVPFTMTATDNVSLDSMTVQYSLSEAWVYNNVLDFTGSNWSYWFNIDTSYQSIDNWTTLYIRALDQFGNISKPRTISFNINRIANPPIIITNEWSDLVTNNETIDIKLELDEDIVKVLYGWLNLTDFQAFSTTFTPTLSLQLGEKNYQFSSIDMLGNKSTDTNLSILKNPTPKEWVYGQDKTIQFEWWVTTNKINLQRVTWDGSAGEIFSR